MVPVKAIGVVLTTVLLLPDVLAATNPKITCDAYAAEKGNVDAQVALANCYIKGVGRPKDFQHARRLLEAAHGAGSASAAAELGSLYLFEMRDPKHYGQAVALLRGALADGYQKAVFLLAVATLNGLGTRKNYSEAFMLFKKSAAMGDPLSAFVLFAAKRYGMYDVKRNIRQSDMWLMTFDQIIANNPTLGKREPILESLKDDQRVTIFLIKKRLLEKAIAVAERKTPASR